MSIENITQKILSEGQNQAHASINNAEEKALEIINEAKIKSELILKEAIDKSKSEAEALISRKKSAAELQSRKMQLSAKQDAIKKAFDTALVELGNMPEDKYINFLADEIMKIPNCEGIIMLNEKDLNKIGEKLVKLVNDRLKGEKISLSQKTINSSGGFILKKGNIEVNSTFETLLTAIKDEVTLDVVNTLFN